MSEEKKCNCGRNVPGPCIGLHKMTNEEYQKHQQKQQQLQEQAKPQLLKG